MRFKRAFRYVSVAVLAMGLLAPQAANAAEFRTSAPASTAPTLELFIKDGQSFEDAVAERIREDPQSRAAALALFGEWDKKLAKGDAVALPRATEPTGRLTADKVQSLRNAVETTASSARTDAALSPPATSAATTTPAATTAAANPPANQSQASAPDAQVQAAWGPVDGTNYNSFPVVGSPGSGKTYWQNMKFALSRQVCQPGKCTITDTYTVRVRVNPGAKTSMYSITSVYSPNSGNFTSEQLVLTAVNKGVWQGSGRTAQLRASDVYYGDSINKLNGTVLTNAVALYVESKTLGTGTNGAKTADSTCATTNNTCRYN